MKLSSQPQMVNSHDLDVLEKFTVMLYDQFRSESNVDSARHTLFTQKNRPYEKIPQTHAALFQNVSGWIHMESGACSTCKITTSKRIGLKEGENGTLYMYVHWTDNDAIADVCHALKNVAAK